MMEQTAKKGPRWTVPRPTDQQWHMVENRYHNSRAKFVIVFHLEPDGSRTPHEMHVRDAEEAISRFPHEWSRFASAAAEPARPAELTPLDRLADLERESRALETRVASLRRELAGTERRN